VEIKIDNIVSDHKSSFTAADAHKRLAYEAKLLADPSELTIYSLLQEAALRDS
jgi:hypothetical protein